MITSAGILIYRWGTEGLEVWIGHMGGPFWARKDEHGWSIPKGEYLPEEEPLAAALREFAEEMGTPAPAAEYELLGSYRQSAQKTVTVYAAEADFAPERIASNMFELEWPRGSGKMREYPEIDRAGWFPEPVARIKLVKGQAQVLDALVRLVGEREH
ncbi:MULTISPECIES: NUDIX domain-containing protein [unclassified Arthrobacter]|uniref:NUDIX domain-containing protein n=1 Tax=unclassified Arthrobacter TaxID=235627 RepID=UPI0024DF51F7|nr:MULTISPECIES: NUDIX domain-containing protein [unclassified Arthrobacter]MCC9145238.1 NUDIX domain-containing protein [Arthrobacter sp. zg-Y919]MDK1276466.1 NUDIX domain-containing protein [Arthrobacter sp. zg.Y919]WIB01935.1 NUDIX domain-containing protein [Arthrobacter sp. zg-Y919]